MKSEDIIFQDCFQSCPGICRFAFYSDEHQGVGQKFSRHPFLCNYILKMFMFCSKLSATSFS